MLRKPDAMVGGEVSIQDIKLKGEELLERGVICTCRCNPGYVGRTCKTYMDVEEHEKRKVAEKEERKKAEEKDKEEKKKDKIREQKEKKEMEETKKRDAILKSVEKRKGLNFRNIKNRRKRKRKRPQQQLIN